MKISNSKKQLAKIIHANGGWRGDAKFSAQDKDGEVFGYCQKPIMGVSREVWGGDGCTGPWATHVDTVRNWHQTILSRDEYFHLYPVAKPVKVVVENKTTCHLAVTDKPTIEQLAADYRNLKDYADRKQQEADAAEADAEAKLVELVAAGRALGLVFSVVGPEPWLAIAVQVGDDVECIRSNVNPNKYSGMTGTVLEVDVDDASTPYLVDFGGEKRIWCHEVKFVRRPTKGDTNA